MKPINLRARFGDRYRITHDPAAFHEPGGRKDPWLYIIPCRKGHIFPHSDKLLALWCESRSRLDKLCPSLRLYQDGEDEMVYLFDPEHFDRVAKLAGAKRRRKLSPALRQAAAERLRTFRFS